MADEPTTSAGTPEAVRVLEQEAIRLYRATYPNGDPWQELSDQTRLMWVTYTEQQRTPPPAQEDSTKGGEGSNGC